MVFSDRLGRFNELAMKLRWKIATGIAAAGIAGVIVFFWRDGKAQQELAETRRDLRAHGFKIDLSEFNFGTSMEWRNRAASLVAVSIRVPAAPLMVPAGSNTAVVLWRRDRLKVEEGQQSLPGLEEAIQENQAALDAACDAAIAGPIRFNLDASAGAAMLLPHLAPLKTLAQTLAARVVMDLHSNQPDAAWTNLLAATRLVTAWNPEPAEISILVRFGYAETVFDATWQALQASGWTDKWLVFMRCSAKKGNCI